MEEFSSKLKKVLAERNISQYALAKKMFISQSVMNEYCTGKKTPSLQVFKSLCINLNVSADYLLDLEDYPII